METTSIPPSPVHGEVLFYKNPQPLTPDMHGGLGLNPSSTPFAFARTAHAVPLIVGEFAPASLSYPIIFAGADRQPLAVMSVRMNENLFIDENGMFPEGVYIPAFIRRYPFVFAHVTDQDQEQLVVCIDREADIVSANPQVPFFENGEPSAFTRQCMEFCSNFEGERRKTEGFVNILKELDLFVLREVTFTPRNPDGSEGQPIKVSDHFSPDEERIKALPDSAIVELVKTGALQQIHAHWASLQNWERLINETLKRAPQTPIGNA